MCASTRCALGLLPSPAPLEVHGYLHVGHGLSSARASALIRVMKDEAGRASRQSPQSQIIAIDDDGSGGLLVSTTTEHLAHRLGKALHAAFGGTLHHGFGHCYKLAFVWWRD
jgi:hypothetical protein